MQQDCRDKGIKGATNYQTYLLISIEECCRLNLELVNFSMTEKERKRKTAIVT